MIEIDICILSNARTPELEQVTRTGIESLLASEDPSAIQFNIFVMEGNKNVKYDYPNTKTLNSFLPFGYHRYLNLCVKEGKAPYVLLANNDLTYEKGWASEIIKYMNLVPELLSASPFCPQTQKQSDWAHSEIHYGYRVRGELAGWCIFVQRKIFNIIGELDTSVSFWYSDNSYSRTLQKFNIQHALIPSSVVNHHEGDLGITGRSVLSPEERQRMTTGQQPAFQKKWGVAY